jgi:hypothetical protein
LKALDSFVLRWTSPYNKVNKKQPRREDQGRVRARERETAYQWIDLARGSIQMILSLVIKSLLCFFFMNSKPGITEREREPGAESVTKRERERAETNGGKRG